MVAASPAVAGDLEDDLDEVRQRINALESQVAGVEADRSPILDEALAAQAVLDEAEAELAATQAEHDRIATQLESIESRLSEVRTELQVRFAHLEVLRGDVERTREQAEAWVVEAYVRGGMAEPGIAFAAGAVADISIGVAYLELLTGLSSGTADRYQEAVDAEAAEEAKVKEVEAMLNAEALSLDRAKNDFETTIASLDEQRAVLAARAAQQSARLAEIDGVIDQYENELAALEREEDSIQALIYAANNPPSSGSGNLIRPVPGAVSSGFGPRIHPIYGTSKMHNGVDMNASQGDPIKAAGSGTVILSGVKGGYGNTVMIDHGGGMVTLYAHQSKLGVSVGQTVSQGEVIGWIGSTGLSTAPHLHFEVRINGTPRNPVNYW